VALAAAVAAAEIATRLFLIHTQGTVLQAAAVEEA
jgi:hypothetical protein